MQYRCSCRLWGIFGHWSVFGGRPLNLSTRNQPCFRHAEYWRFSDGAGTLRL